MLFLESWRNGKIMIFGGFNAGEVEKSLIALHDIFELDKILAEIPFKKEKPNLILANTCKGKGVSFMENVVSWHHRVPTEEEYKLAMNELNNKLKKLNNA